ncbi:MAG: protein kinase [Anaerolineales bacterium]
MNSTLSENPMDVNNPGWPPDPPGYHLVDKLGKGGMGVVYRAQDLNTGQFVAIKFALGVSLLRFQREYRQLAGLEHPYILKVYRFDALALPPHMVMEYLPGQTLTDYRKGFPGKRLPYPIGIPLLLQLTEALVYLHNLGIVHRDLKPRNLMVLGEREHPSLKLMDFGLVRPAQVSQPLTQDGSFMGTPEYAAPEQFLDTANVTDRADLYALGVIMCEMFTGQRPFNGTDTASLRDQHLNVPPSPPSLAAPEISPELEKLILALLEKDPDKRPATAAAVQFALNNILTGFSLGKQVALQPAAQITKGSLLNQRYCVEQQLGQGGYGTVYKAQDRVLLQTVAIKVNADVSAEAARKFQREVNLLGSLNHPNLPRVRAYFVEGDAQFMVMDFISGRNLAEMLKDGPIPEAKLLPWADQVCSALDYLHRQRPPVIHRDVKPENIIIDENNRAHLVDFGIAKIDPAARTTTASLAGTPGYAPLEQHGRSVDRTDARSDIYALGATLYHALTGQRPAESMALAAGLEPAARPAHELNPAVSSPVSRAVRRAMGLRPDQRPASIAEFNAALHSRPHVFTRRQIAVGCAFVLFLVFWSATLSALGFAAASRGWLSGAVTHTPTQTPTSSPARPSQTPRLAPTASHETMSTLVVTQIITITPTVHIEPTGTRTSTTSAAAVLTPSGTPFLAPASASSRTPTFAPSLTPSFTPSATLLFMSAMTQSKTPSLTPSATSTQRSTFTPSVTSMPTKMLTFTPSITPTWTKRPTVKPLSTLTPSNTPSLIPTATPSTIPTVTPTVTLSETLTLTVTLSPTPREIAEITPTVASPFTPTPIIVNAAISPDFGACSTQHWYKIAGAGYDGTDIYLTLNTNVQANSTNSARWTPNLPIAGQYKVEMFAAFHRQITWQCVPNTTIGYDTSDARYTVYMGGSLLQTVAIDQKPLNNQWATIGTYSFPAGASSYVILNDLNGESQLTRTISFNVLRFTYVGP